MTAGTAMVVLLTALTLAWIVVTPMGASPDEPAHLIKAAATVRFEGTGLAGGRPQDRVFTVPESVASSTQVSCFAFHPNLSAKCLRLSQDPVLVRSVSTAGLYNPVYYALVGWPSFLPIGTAALYMMRLVSTGLVLLFVTVAIVAVAPRRSSARILLLAATPVALFLAASVNPNAFEWATAIAFTATLLTIARTTQHGGTVDQRHLLIWCNIAGVLLVQTRQLSPAFAALIVLLVLIGTAPSWRRSIHWGWQLSRWVWPTAVSGVLAVVYTVMVGSTAVGVHPPVPSSLAEAFVGALRRLPEWWHQMIAVFGWLDVALPVRVSAAFAGLVLVIIGALARDAVWQSRQLLVTAAIAAVAVAVIPVLLESVSAVHAGYVWQGRYALPLWGIFVVFLTACGRRTVDGRDGVMVLAGRGVIAALWALQNAALGVCAYRYGLDTYAPAAWVALGALMLTATGAGLLQVELTRSSRQRVRPVG